MANTVLEFEYFSGLVSSMTVDLTQADDTSIVTGLSSGGGTLSEETNGKGRYQAIHAGAQTGHIRLHVLISSALVATFDFYVAADDTNTYYALPAALAAAGGYTAQTGDNYARLGAPAGASIAADIAAIPTNPMLATEDGSSFTAIPWNASWDAEVQSECNDALVALGLDHLVAASVTGTDVVDNSIVAKLVSSSATADWDDFVNTTDSLQAVRDHIGDGTNLTEAGGTGDHLSAIPWNASWDAEVQSECSDALTAASLTTAGIADAVWDEAQSGHVTAGTFGAYLDAAVSSVSGTAGSGSDNVTITWTSGGNPVQGGEVWVSSDESGDTVVAGTLVTDDSGQATFLLDNGSTYYLWGKKPGVNSILGERFVAVAD